MNRVGYIWEDFCTLDNAIEAIYRGTENKRSDRAIRRTFGYTDDRPEHHGKLNQRKVDRYAKTLVDDLAAGRWQHQAGLKRTIISGKKVRDIEIARLRDHIVQWMALLAIQDYLIRRMYRYSCGNLPRRGIEFGRKTVQRWVRSGDCKYFVKLDVRHFYQTVDLDKLSAMVHRHFKDKRFLQVLDSCIYSSPITAEDGVTRNLAIGYYSSPWFANIYLSKLDWFITGELYKERRGKRIRYVRHYLRQVDDLLLMGSSKSDLKKAVKAIIAYCRDELNLEIKACWEICQIAELLPPDANGKRKIKPGTTVIDIVGYRFSTSSTTVRDANFLRTSRLARRMKKHLEQRGVVYLRNAQSLNSHIGWFSHADSIYFVRHYISPYVDVKFLKEVVGFAAKNGIGGEAARVYCCKRGGQSGYRILYGRCRGDERRYGRFHGNVVDDRAALDA